MSRMPSGRSRLLSLSALDFHFARVLGVRLAMIVIGSLDDVPPYFVLYGADIKVTID